MNWNTATEHLEKNGFPVHRFATGAEAAAWLNEAIDGTTVAFGGSMTLRQLGLYESLSEHNEVLWHWRPTQGRTADQTRYAAMDTEVYLCSANAVTEGGYLVNVDGSGNRVAGTMFGHKRLYYVLSEKKLVSDLAAAEERIRNVAAPPNCLRLGMKTPCGIKGDRCYHCDSPDCPLRGMVVHMHPMTGQVAEIVLIAEEFGY